MRDFYRGWEGELLAAHLLSRISMLAQPMSVQTDLGRDSIGTLFEVDETASPTRLKPLQSFAIQVKTTVEAFEAVEMTRNLSYLERLALPFFHGSRGFG